MKHHKFLDKKDIIYETKYDLVLSFDINTTKFYKSKWVFYYEKFNNRRVLNDLELETTFKKRNYNDVNHSLYGLKVTIFKPNPEIMHFNYLEKI